MLKYPLYNCPESACSTGSRLMLWPTSHQSRTSTCPTYDDYDDTAGLYHFCTTVGGTLLALWSVP